MGEYYIFNKPRGPISARRDARHETVMDYFPEDKRDVLFPIGRLDRDTEGLMIVTDDGALAHRLMSPENKIAKTYYFVSVGTLTEEKRAELERGITINVSGGFTTAPATVKVDRVGVISDFSDLLSEREDKLLKKKPNTPATSGYVTVTEGKKHEVRLMLGYAGCRVVFLRRVSIAGLMLDRELELGKYRPLTKDELSLLK
ncbi:MAG: pseudouridine synthase [Clostridia bacterium]|nr:pseudouridine synthase [Clostridia bacterium]